MNKRLFTFLFALATSVGMSWAEEQVVTWNSQICHDINCTAGGNSNNSHYNITATWSIDPFYVPDGTGFTNNTMTFKRAYGNFSFTSAIGAITKVVINGTDLTDVGVDHWTASDGGTKLTWTDAYLTDPPKTKTVYLRYGEGAADVTTFTVNSIEFYVDNDCALELDYFPICQLVTDGWMGLGPDPGESVNLTMQSTNNPFGKTNAGWKLQSAGHYIPNATTEQINTQFANYDDPQEAYDQITSIISDLLNYYTQTNTESANWAEYSAKIEVYELMKYNNSTSSYEHVKIYSGAGAASNETGYGVIYSYWKTPDKLCDLHLAGFDDAPYVFFMEAWIKNTQVYNARVYYLQNETKDDPTFVRNGGTISSSWGGITALLEFDPEDVKKEVIINEYNTPTTRGEIAYTGWNEPLINTGSAHGATWEYSLDGIFWGTESSFYSATATGTYTIYCRIVPDVYHKYSGDNPVVTLTATIVPPFVIDTQDPSSVLYTMYNVGTPSDLLVKRTIYADGYYNTLCLPFNITAEELATSTHPLYGYETLKTMRGAQVSGSEQNLSIDIFVEDVTEIEAGQPYLISYPADRAGGDIVNPYFEGITVTMYNNPGSVSAGGVTFQGMFGPKHIDSYTVNNIMHSGNATEDYLFLGEQNKLTWPLNDGQNMRGFRAYFIIDRNQITPAMAPANTRARLIDVQKMPTGVDEIGQEFKAKSQKVLENGVLYIIKNGVRYNAQGQMVK